MAEKVVILDIKKVSVTSLQNTINGNSKKNVHLQVSNWIFRDRSYYWALIGPENIYHV